MESLCPFASGVYDPTAIFKGPCDYGHAALGFATALVPERVAALAAFSFVLYESLRAKPCSQKIAALGQFAVGFMLARALQYACAGRMSADQ